MNIDIKKHSVNQCLKPSGCWASVADICFEVPPKILPEGTKASLGESFPPYWIWSHGNITRYQVSSSQGSSKTPTAFQLLSCVPMNCSTTGFPVLHSLPEFAQTHVHWVGDAIQPSHPLSPTSPLALNLSQHHSFAMSQLLALRRQSIGASASASVLQWMFRVYFF